ncbi:MAG: thrombospondin type 3 repeat-containing protein [Muribaculaceae bacterium]|nr:thrombospondin type 3 repeat-containing protein [Muribaculaceae bacterium]
MKTLYLLSILAIIPATLLGAGTDPDCVVEKWSDNSASPKIIDINFSDATWPSTWAGETGRDCPSLKDGGYVNAILTVPTLGGESAVNYPVVFHNCTFATKESYNGYAGATAAFCRQYYLNEKPSGNSNTTYNNWTVAGHTSYLEDNITYDSKGTPTHGEAGFVQMCRDAAVDGVSSHGWMEIDHIPYVDRIQWSWSSTSWGRGIKCDIKIGSADWQPLVWMGSEKQKQGWTVFSDQGYFMENIINASDVSLRWRVWDGENLANPVQDAVFTQGIDPMAERQAPRVHKLRIFGTPITADQAKYARENLVSDPGEISDLSQYGVGGGDEPQTAEPADAILTAFPSAEGFGRYATGGRGGKVVKVTSLADDGTPGTLRWAFDQHKGEPITIVFEVSGDIALRSELRVNRADWTLAGQTAPGEGIVVTRNKVNLGGSENFIVRNMRFRIGRLDVSGNLLTENALGAENCSNFIFDHCSFGWSVEENMNTADSHFLTVQHSIVHEGLYNAGHSKGNRGYGCQWGGSPATYHHNLLTGNNSRSPRLNGARGDDYVVFIEYANNVNYNYSKEGGCYGGENTADIAQYNGLNSAHECNFMSNFYKPGPASNKDKVIFVNASYARENATSWAPSKWFIDGNAAAGIAGATADNWTAVTAETYSLSQIKADSRITPANPYWKYTVAATVGNYTPSKYMLTGISSADDAFAHVTAHAGTINRDKVERRIIADAIAGTATFGGSTLGQGILDKETDAEGFFTYSTDYTVLTDTDGDGMPDEWEKTAKGLDPNTPDQNKTNPEGRTALEVYLNSLMGEQESMEFGATSLEVINARPAITLHGDMLTVGNEAVGAIVEIYSTAGILLDSRRITSTATHLRLVQGLQLVRVSGHGLTPVTLKVCR